VVGCLEHAVGDAIAHGHPRGDKSERRILGDLGSELDRGVAHLILRDQNVGKTHCVSFLA
jgi:hypothetical protein